MKREIRRIGTALLTLCAAAWLPMGASAAGDAEAGKALYAGLGTCFTCHGDTGKGDGLAAAALDPKPRDFSAAEFKYDADKDGTPGSDADLALIIKNGAAVYGGSPLMTPFGHLNEQQIVDIIAFIRTLKK